MPNADVLPHLLAIDPGTDKSGWVLFDTHLMRVAASGVMPNADLLIEVRRSTAHRLAIEMISGMGMAVGKETFHTCVWVGRFMQAWKRPEEVRLIERREVKLAICGSTRAKDPNIRQALIDRIGPPGKKASPGPTYGVASHAWPALAVAVTLLDIERERRAA